MKKRWPVFVVVAIMMLWAVNAVGQPDDNGYVEKINKIVIEQVVPEGVKDLPYISFSSAKGAYQAWQDMPKPNYIVIIKQMFTMDPKKEPRLIGLYRVYFTPTKLGGQYRR